MNVKIILLEGNKNTVIEIDSENVMKEVQRILGVSNLQGYHTFGRGYTALWQEERIEKTSMEITVYAGASWPIFIDSKVIITNEDAEGNYIDVDIKKLKKHFRTSNAFWALVKN